MLKLKIRDMTSFIYKDELFIRVIPVKSLFNSNLIHSATVRGDIFAMRVSDQALTIVPGKAAVEHTNSSLNWMQETPAQLPLALNDVLDTMKTS